MPLPFFLAILFGKGAATKIGAAGAKGLAKYHAHHSLARTLAKQAAQEAVKSGMRACPGPTRQRMAGGSPAPRTLREDDRG